MKRILFLSDINSPHTQKWVSGLASQGFMMGVFSLTPSQTNWYKHLPNVLLLNESTISKKTFTAGIYGKLQYLSLLPQLKKVVKSFKPNLLHANYASSYGLLGALLNFKPFIITVWGSDVFDFPQNHFINRSILKYNLRKADVIVSASKIMCSETAKYTNTQVIHIPFGIDANVFVPSVTKSNRLLIGTIKRLEYIYGVDILIKAFALIADKVSADLLIVGNGVSMNQYRTLAKSLNIESRVKFTGWIPHEQTLQYHQMINIFVAVSRRESFGVAVLEASACGNPVLVSNAGGLPEVVANQITGIIVEPDDVTATANALLQLCNDAALRNSMGQAGRKFVIKHYNWPDNLMQMVQLYNQYV
ncbi:MAG: glycosyltransferase [Bacteroidia bacterium]|nr:glycosyltransferase [Bacteroidia bacterium]HQV00796.1 glycosyltransferase [Bacteroidia bacterium]